MLGRFALILLIPFSVIAQGRPATREWGQRAGNYRLSISSDKTTYEIGEQVRITSILKNITDHGVRLEMTARRTWYKEEVLLPTSWLPWRQQALLTPEGRKVRDRQWGNVVGLYIPAGKEIVDEADLSSKYDMSRPGDYKITFSVREPVQNADDADGIAYPRVWIISNSIIVTVLPAK